jgi:hypothetical protein
MVLKAQSNNLLVGMAPDIVDNGVTFFFYADDNVIYLSHEPDEAVNVKL